MSRSTAPRASKSGVWKRRLVGLAKVAISVGLLAYLFAKAAQDDSFQQLRQQPKDWAILAAALAIELLAVMITIVRWHLLVRAVELPFTLREAFRLGFLGFLLNFFTVGAIGGDAIRAVFVARRNPGRGTVAAATVVVDRLFGLFALVLLVSVGFFATDWTAVQSRDPQGLRVIQDLCHVALGGSVAGTVAIAVLLLPGFTSSPLWDVLARLPGVGGAVASLIEALRMYRRRLPILTLALTMSLGVHTLLALGLYLIAQGLYGQAPGIAQHLVVSPMASAFGALPLPGGLGAFEVALDFLYRRISPDSTAASQGFVVAIGYRVMTLLIAAIGVGYYLTSRSEMRTLMQAAEEQWVAAEK